MTTPPVEQPLPTCTFDAVVARMAHRGKINPPLTDEERRLAHTVAEAHYFYTDLAELPAAGPWDSTAVIAMWMGISRVLSRWEGVW
jgi:hypothetical protein